ncbi:hypothetical protein [Pseudorhodoferax sp.]|uniref:hypothetical protein n=1 Tax=Pseudorhodoferax sp. TaxID=1993553 RepID=UPI002DD69E41|nr:hypothetical protein [Pseudorhodoferax sp.]
MPLPFAVAAVAALAAGGYHYYKRNEAAQRERQGRAFKLPPCCAPVLSRAHSYGPLAGALGVTISAAKLVGDVNPANTPFLVTADWPAEGQAHADVAIGLQALAATAVLDTVFDHYRQHMREDSDAQRFWAAAYARVKARHGNKTNYESLLDAFEEKVK